MKFPSDWIRKQNKTRLTEDNASSKQIYEETISTYFSDVLTHLKSPQELSNVF